MESKKKENLTDENGKLQAETLVDLPVADEQADETKAGDLFMNFKFTDRHNPSM